MYVSYGDDPAAMARQILEQIKPEQGLNIDAAIGIKPNLVVAKGWHSGATTNPAICAAVIEYFQERGFRNIAVIESAWLAVDTAKAFKVCGYEELARQYDVELIDVKKGRCETREFGGMKIAISARALTMDYIVNLPLIKGHSQTGITCALKNLKGLIPDREKRRFHAMGLHKPIACLNKMISSSLTIADGTCTDPNFEEGGHPARLNTMIAGTDSVLVDAYAAGLLGYKPADIEYITTAERIGVGSADVSGAEIMYLNSALQTAQVTRSAALEAAKALVDADKACSACYGNLLSALICMAEAGTPMDACVSVGQGFRGRDGAMGCGNCTQGFEAYVKGCPPTADEIFTQFTAIRRTT